jgi:hypothetical protein
MVNKNKLHIALLSLALLFLPLSLPAAFGAQGAKNIVISLPAETVLASLQKALPLDVPSQSRQLQGDITLESMDRLAIHDNIVTVRGVLSGRNLVVTTRLAGQDLQVRVGQVRLPMTCDLQLRFDPAKHKLFVTPRFADAAQNGDNSEDALAPLLGALNGREYQVDLDALEMINIKVGTKSIPIAMDPVKIAGVDNTLIFHLLPRVGAVR